MARTTKRLTVTSATPVRLDTVVATDSFGRQSVGVQSIDGPGVVLIGGPGITTANGWRVPVGAAFTDEATNRTPLYALAATTDVVIDVMLKDALQS